MTAEINPNLIVSERPITGIEEDRLGLNSLAESMAETIKMQTRGDGFVIAVQGSWGSGKSSLLNLLESRLRPASWPADQILGAGQPIVRRFNPWLVGAREALLTELFEILIQAFEDTFDPKHGVVESAGITFNKLRRELQTYAGLLDAGAKVAPAVEKVLMAHGIPLHGALATTAKAAAAASKKPELSLAKQKKVVTDLLQKAPRRVLIMVDDLDRLEPKEAVEVLRLVKAVADFPNTIYILAYAPDLLANAIEKQLSVPNGHAFLEKLVQVSYNIPSPDDYDLRLWLREALRQIVDGVYGARPKPAYQDRLAQLLVTDVERLLRTPRDVVRVANAFRVAWPPVARSVDIVDFIWLTLTRIKRPPLFDWVRDYCAERSQVELGARTDEDALKDLEKRFLALAEAGDGAETELRRLRAVFPSLALSEGRIDLLPSPGPEAESLRRDRRLASGHYARFYFAQRNTVGAFAPADESALDAALADPGVLASFLRDKAKIERPQGGDMAAYAIDTLLQRFEQLSAPARSVIGQTLSDVLDELALNYTSEFPNRWRSWDAGTPLLRRIIETTPPPERSILIARCFGSGRAICWLTRAALSMKETSAKDLSDIMIERQAWASEATLLLLPRLNTQPLAAVPSVLNFLWPWQSLGDNGLARLWASKASQTEEDFLMLMDGLRGLSFSTQGVERPLQRRNVSPFLDFDAASKRLAEISQAGGPHATQALKLIAAIAPSEVDSSDNNVKGRTDVSADENSSLEAMFEDDDYNPNSFDGSVSKEVPSS